jgi:exonuclease SbcC
MRIHRLTFAALGPYPGEHVIDFDALGDSGLFIIEGPTGAGKSTILDAIVFALYSDVAGDDSDKQRLRSAFCDPEAETFAEIEFSSTSGLFRVRRTPEYSRPRKRGVGAAAVVAPTVSLWRSTGEQGWEPVSTRHREAEIEILAAVGLDKSQFLQTVVLPQGEFATFLRAKSAERQDILERVFATEVFSRLAKWADEQRRTAERQITEARLAVGNAAQQLSGRLVGSGFDAEIQELGSAIGADEETDHLPLALERALEVTTSRATRSTALEMEAVEQSRALEVVVAAIRAWLQARAAVEQATAQWVAAQARRDEALAVVASHVGVLEPILGEEVDLGDLDAAAGKVDELIGSLETVSRRGAELPALARELATLSAAILTDEAAEAGLRDEQAQVIPARLRWCADELNRRSHALDEAHTEAKVGHDALIQARVDGMAGELAGQLVDGSPCPVCGALEHRQPAPIGALGVTPDDISAASERVQSAADRRVALSPHVATVTTLLEQNPPEVIDAADRDDAAAVYSGEPIQVLADAQDRLRHIAKELPAIGSAIARSSEAVERLLVTEAGIEAELSQAAAGYASLDARLAGLRDARKAVAALRGFETALSAAAAATQAATALFQSLPEPASAGVEAIDAQWAAVQEAASAAATRADSDRQLASNAATLIDAVTAARTSLGAVIAQFKPVVSVADILNGRGANQLLQPLKAYVLQQMFDEVIEAANIRLMTMLDGRFELIDTELAQGRERLLGLGLAVMDRATDSTRRAETLSGGETFCASLALALGLADTVRAHAGGIDIGMLFVDEGFGSLDADRLDDVMAELLRLRADGRTVGVISHVAEMQKSIPERISVRPIGPGAGSTLSVTWQSE